MPRQSWSRGPRRNAAALLLLLLGLLLVPGAAAICPAGTVMGVGSSAMALPDTNPKLTLYAAAQGETADPFLGVGAPGPATPQYKGGSTPFEFKSNKGLTQPYWLNLSLPIVGTVSLSSATMQQNGKADLGRVRIELYVGEARAGGADIDLTAIGPGGAGGWRTAPLCFRAEVSEIQPGQLVRLVVTPIGMETVWIGTSGDLQTKLEIQYFDSDPLAGALYRNGSQLSMNEPEAAPAPNPESPTTGAGAALPALVPVLLAGLSLRARKRPALGLVLLLAASGLAGCLGSPKSAPAALPRHEEAPPTSTLESKYEPNETLAKEGHGAVKGVVLDGDRHDKPIGKAHIAILGTPLFGETDAKGEFVFGNVSKGRFDLMVAVKPFPPFTEEIDVRVGSTTNVRVVLHRVDRGPASQYEHYHDDWNGFYELEYQDVTFPLATTTYPTSPDASEAALASTGQWYCSHNLDKDHWCETVVPIDYSKPVLDGTGEIIVTFTWQASGTNTPPEFGLRVETTKEQGDRTNYYVPRAAGDAFHIAIFPNEADPGHQKITQWIFFLVVPKSELDSNPMWASDQDVHAGMKIRKGVVPLEPAHPDLWKGGSFLTFAASNPIGGSGANGCPSAVHYPTWTYPSPGCGWYLGSFGAIIPPGTKEIGGTLSWTQYSAAADGVKWTLAFKPANRALYSVPLEEMPQVTVTNRKATNDGFDFIINLTGLEGGKLMTDQFYQTNSYWVLLLDDDGENGGLARATNWNLRNLRVLRDPTFADDRANT